MSVGASTSFGSSPFLHNVGTVIRRGPSLTDSEVELVCRGLCPVHVKPCTYIYREHLENYLVRFNLSCGCVVDLAAGVGSTVGGGELVVRAELDSIDILIDMTEDGPFKKYWKRIKNKFNLWRLVRVRDR